MFLLIYDIGSCVVLFILFLCNILMLLLLCFVCQKYHIMNMRWSLDASLTTFHAGLINQLSEAPVTYCTIIRPIFHSLT